MPDPGGTPPLVFPPDCGSYHSSFLPGVRGLGPRTRDMVKEKVLLTVVKRTRQTLFRRTVVGVRLLPCCVWVHV